MTADLANTPLADPPAWLIERACGPVQRERTDYSRNEILEGKRNDELARIAGALRRRGCSFDEILAALKATNEKRCRPPLPESEVVGVARSVMRYEPEAGWTTDQQPSAAETDQLRLTDVTNADRFVSQHQDRIRYTDAWEWLTYDGQRWHRGRVDELAKATVSSWWDEIAGCKSSDERTCIAVWARKSESEPRIRAMVALAQTDPRIYVHAGAFDADPYVLNTPSGTLDLRTRNLRPHAPDDLLTKITTAPYAAAAPCPRWEGFLREIFAADEELIAYVQRAVGYSLVGEIPDHVFFVEHGTGSNGKTTFNETIAHTLGDYAQTAAFDSFVAGSVSAGAARSDLVKLVGARFVAAAEVGSDRHFDEPLLKRLTGADTFTARELYRPPFSFRPGFKIWLATNHRPRVKGSDHGFWRRVRLIPFEVHFHDPGKGEPIKETGLPEKLKGEMAGILAWAVRGYLAWHQHGLGEAGAVNEATREYRDSEDIFAQFIAECCVVSEGLSVGATELYMAYRRWCDVRGERADFQTSVGERLTERGFRRLKNWKGLIVRAGIALRQAEGGV